MKERIRLIMENEHLTPSAFADTLQVGRAVISHILNGRNNPSLEIVTRILSKLNYINPEWLLTGEGEMYKSDEKYKKSQVAQPITAINSNPVTPINSSPNNTADLFAQNPINSTKGEDEKKYEQENELKEPVLHVQNIEKENIIYQKQPDRNISQIIIYYSDNTFETFISDKRSS